MCSHSYFILRLKYLGSVHEHVRTVSIFGSRHSLESHRILKQLV
jgi:hypothetical protein